MVLSERLTAIAGMVTPGLPAVDVGCDHAWIPIYLTENEIVPWAAACDLRSGPLKTAEEHIRAAHLSARIRTILCDGVPKEPLAGNLIIAGMGGPLAARILSEAGEFLSGYENFVFEVQSDLSYFRRSLEERRLVILDEEMLLEDGKFYTVMRAGHREKAAAHEGRLTEEELLFGPVLLRKKDHVLHEYLERQRRICEGIRLKLADSGYGDDSPRAGEILKELRLIGAAEERYEMS